MLSWRYQHERLNWWWLIGRQSDQLW